MQGVIKMSLTLDEMIAVCEDTKGARNMRIQISRHDLKILGERISDANSVGVVAIWSINKSAHQVFDEAINRFKQHVSE